MPTTAQDLINEASKHVGATYSNGAGRTWGASVAAPPSFDCSGFIKYLGVRTGAGDPGNVSDAQYANAKAAGLAIASMDQARRTPGALLFKPGAGNNGHVAMVYNAQGDTIEATGSGGGVRIVKGGALKSYFTEGALMPGVDYSGSVSPPTLAAGTTSLSDSTVAPTGSNNLATDPAYQIANLAALLSGKNPADIQAAGTALGADHSIGDQSIPGQGVPGTMAIDASVARDDQTQWAKDFLTTGGFPVSDSNMKAIIAWQKAEKDRKSVV